MTKRLLVTSIYLIVLAALPGCHYYIRATPHIVISDSPLSTPNTTPEAP